MSTKTRRWKSLFGSSKGPEAAREQTRKRRERRTLFMEALEDRRLLATFDGSGADLLLELNTNDAVTSVANGTNYTLTLASGNWGGSDVGGKVTGTGTSTLTVIPDQYGSLLFTDSGTNTKVTFGDSGANAYSDSFSVTLDQIPASPSVVFSGQSSFGANNLTVDATAISFNNASSDVTLDGNGAATLTAVQWIRLSAGASLTTDDGDISLSANAAGTAVGDFHGIQLAGGTVQSTGSGAISLVGRGAGPDDRDGVSIISGGQVLGGTGNVAVTGTGGAGTGSSQSGVVVSDTASKITSSGGNVTVTGQGGGVSSSQFDYGVFIGSGGLISAGGAGTVSVTGTGGAASGNSQVGVGLAGGGTITSSGGDVTVVGVGGGSGSSANDYGVHVEGGSSISAGGTGTVTVNGTGGGGTGDRQEGVRVGGSGSEITSAGDVIVTGQGGGAGGSRAHGVDIDGAVVTSTGTGTVSVTGTGGAGALAGGVVVENGSLLSAEGSGSVLLTGTGGPGSGNGHYGVIVAASQVTATGSGEVQINGTGGSGSGDFASGVVVQGGGTVTTSGGNISVSGQGGGSGGAGNAVGVGIAQAGSTISAGGGGNVVIAGTGGGGSGTDNTGVLILLAGASINASPGGGSVTITGTAGSGTGQFSVDLRDGGAVTTDSGTISIDGKQSSGGLSGDIRLNGPVTSSGADIAIGADRDILGNGDGDVSSGAGGGNIVMTADQDSTGAPNDAGAIQTAGDVTAGTGTVTLSLTDSDGFLNGIIVSADQVVKTGTGVLDLGGANTYTGGTTISQGEIHFSNNSALGTGVVTLGDANTGTNDVALLGTGVFAISNDIIVANEGSGTATLGSINVNPPGAGLRPTVFAGTVTMQRDVSLQAGNTDRTNFDGQITGTGDLTISSPFGTRRVVIQPTSAAANDFNGDLFIGPDAILQLGVATAVADRAIPDTANVHFANADSELRFTSTSSDGETVGALISDAVGAGKVTKDTGSTSTVTLTLGANNGSGDFSGVISNAAGNLALVKTGSGTQTLSGNNSYRGNTDVNGGTLLVNGTLSVVRPVTVNSGGTLGGTGSIAGTVIVNTGGVISPATAGTVGALTVGGLTFNGGTYQGDVLDNSSDRITTAGSLSLGAGTFTLNILTSGSQTVDFGNVYRLINNTSANPIGSVFSNVPDGDTTTVYTKNATYSYFGSLGSNDFTLSVDQGPIVSYVEATSGTNEDYHLVRNGGNLELYSGGTISVTGGVISYAGGSQVSGSPWPAAGVSFFTLDGNGGTDRLLIDYTGTDGLEDVNILFQGGGATTGSALFVKGGASPDFGKVIYEYLDAHNGLIENFSDAAGTTIQSFILYLGLDPITSTVNATNVVLDYTGAAETVTVTPGPVASQTNAVSTEGESTTFNNPTGALTIETHKGTGADTIEIEGVGSGWTTADLIIDGDSDDTISFQTTATIIGTGDLTADARTINVGADIETTLAGEISLSAEGSIEVMAALIAAEDGDIVLQADGGGAAGTGILVSNSEVTTTTGNISLGGSSGSTGDGVYVNLSSIDTTSGDIEILGQSGSGDGISVVSSDVTSVDGSIALFGDTSGTTSSSEGVSLELSSIETEGDIIEINGRSDGGDGIAIQNGSAVRNLNEDIFLSGDGAAVGVSVDDSEVSSADGMIGIDGTGDENGIEVTNDASVSTVTGLIIIDGQTSSPASYAGLYMAVNQPAIYSDTGGIEVSADDDVVMSDDARIVSTSNDVTVEAAGDVVMEDAAEIRGVSVDVDAEGDVVMSDQSRIVGDGGIARVVADGDVFVATIAAASDVYVGAGGAIIDNSDSDIDITSNGVAELRASAGIGDGNALETDVPTLAAENAFGAGNIEIDNSASGAILEIGATMDVTGVTVSGTGDIRLTAFDLDVTEVITASDGDVELFSSNATRTFALGSGPAVKGSGITTGSAAYGLDDAELDLITASGARSVIGNGSADQFNVNYTGSDTQAINVLGLDGNDEFFVAPSGTTSVSLDGGSPSAPASPGDTLHLDMSGAVAPVIVDTIGGFAISASTATVSFVEMETLDLCDDSGDIDNAHIGDLYVRTTDNRERITFTLWNDGGVKLRIDDLDARTSTTYPQHFGLVGGVQMLQELLVYAQGGDDYVTIAGHVVDSADQPIPVEFQGEEGNDYLAGANGDDVLVGGPGNDRVLGGEGDNLLYGDGNEPDVNGIPIEQPTDGDDYVSGRTGNDIIFGGGGTDRLYGSDGNDYLHAGSGNDLVDGGLNDDVIIGADGNDSLSGNYGNDILLGGGGVDQLFGRQGDDVLLGGSDADRVRGDSGDDLVIGGNAANVRDTTSDAALRAIVADWIASKPVVPAALGMLLTDGVEDLLIGDLGADAFHAGSGDDPEDRVYDFRVGDGDLLLP